MAYADIQTKVRDLVEDFSKSIIDVFTYSTSSVFTLSEENPIAVSDVSVNDIPTSNYTYNATTKKVTITDSLTSGDSVKITYTYYSKYSVAEIQGYIKAAITQININDYGFWKLGSNDEIYPTPSAQEESLIAMVASIIAEPNNSSYSLPDVKVTVPKSLPTRDLVRKTINLFKRPSGAAGVFEVL